MNNLHSLTHGIFLKDFIYSTSPNFKACLWPALHLQKINERMRDRCYNSLACRRYDRPLSVAKVIMTKLKGKDELDQFTLSRSEYAKELGITPNAVRMRMRHGKLDGEYRFDGSKYIFRSPDRLRENYEKDHPVINKLTTLKKKKIKRGNHFKANYPNEAFRLHNEHKKEQAILNKIQGKFKSEAHRLEYEKLNNEALKKSLENTEKKNKEAFSPMKNYGGPVSMGRNSYPEDYNPQPTVRKPFRGYDYVGSDDYDDGSVEIDLSRSSSRPFNDPPIFESKVAESIWRLKNKK